MLSAALNTCTLFRFQAQVQVIICTSDYLLDWRFQGISSLSLINLLEQLTEFRKPVYSLDQYLIIGLLQRMLKDTNQ